MHFVPVDLTSEDDVAREFRVESKTIAVLAESQVFDGVFPIKLFLAMRCFVLAYGEDAGLHPFTVLMPVGRQCPPPCSHCPREE